MRLFLALPLLALAACGGGDNDDAAIIEDSADTPEVVAVEGRDITAIDAATDNDAGLADEDVPGRNADADGEED